MRNYLGRVALWLIAFCVVGLVVFALQNLPPIVIGIAFFIMLAFVLAIDDGSTIDW